jgi:hypothetical protein
MKARNLLLFHTLDKKVNVSVHFSDGTFWLTQKAMAELFGVNVPAVNKHLKNIYDTGELTRDATVSILEIVRTEGSREVTKSMEFYRLEAILAVGYRVNSVQATEFRKWATTTLNEFIIKGFTHARPHARPSLRLRRTYTLNSLIRSINYDKLWR